MNIKDQIVLSEEIGKYIKTKKRGNLTWARCPFHGEETASFVINDEKKFFYCFGCGASGDIFSFFQKHLNKNFKETLEDLSKTYKIPINFKNYKNCNENLQKILDFALSYYEDNLKKKDLALEYFKKRKISEESIAKFKLGYAEESTLIQTLINQGFSIEDIKKSGLNSYGMLDRFRNRIIFPIINKNNKVIGFAGRVLDDSNPKYINSSETDLFQKNLHIFNENNLKNNHPIILVEGYMDVISLTQKGIENVVASMGTAISPGQLISIFRSNPNLYIMLDGDSSGQAAVERIVEIAIKILNPDLNIFIFKIEENLDPDNLAQSIGDFSFHYIQNHSQSLLDWKWNKVLSMFQKSPNSLAKIFENIEFFLSNIQNKNLRKAYKTFFEDKILDLKKNFKSIRTPVKEETQEDIVIIIIFNLHDVLDVVIEDLMSCVFRNKNYENIRCDIIDKMTIDGWDSTQTITFLLKKYETFLSKILKQKNFSYIISNRSFVLQYLTDTLRILQRSNIGLLE